MQQTSSPVIQEPTLSEFLDGVPNTKFMNQLGQGPTMNTKSNIISGPNPMSYWNHSPGFEKPEVREEGPLPIQGNVGALLANEATNNYALCSPSVDGQTIPEIGSSPNCSGYFKPDLYTLEDTCGAECQLKYPESYGEKDFGFPDNMPWNKKITNAHQVHAYQNIRAANPGQGPSKELGCYEWIPNVSSDKEAGTCVLDQEPVYDQVGAWNKLPMYANLQKVTWN